MDKVFRRLSMTSVNLCFELQIKGVVFPNLPKGEFEEVIVTFNRQDSSRIILRLMAWCKLSKIMIGVVERRVEF